MTGENDKNKPGGSFSEEELASALANMENELNSILEDASGLPENGRKEAEKSNSDEKAGDLAGSSHSDNDLPNDDICDDDSILDDLSMDMFDEELEGITGERAECALILTVFGRNNLSNRSIDSVYSRCCARQENQDDSMG